MLYPLSYERSRLSIPCPGLWLRAVQGGGAERIGPGAPVTSEAGAVTFGDPDARFAELTAMLLTAIARLLPEK